MRYIRLAIGVLIIFGALWVIFGEQMSGASANATVNARLTTVKSPIAGQISIPARTLGSFVSKDEVLATTRDDLVDGVRLDDLIAERDIAQGELDAVVEEIASAAEIMAALDERSGIFREERILEIETRLSHARTRLGNLNDEPEQSGAGIDQARELVEILEIHLRAAQRGVFLGDGYNDAPNSEQRLAELRSVTASLENRRQALSSRRDIWDERLERERLRVNRFSNVEMPAPVDGLFWEIHAGSGETVQRGDPVVTMIDCSSVMVTLSVTEGVYNRLSVGDAAVFRFTGEGETYPGTVSRLAGPGAATVYRNLAVAPSQQHLERFDVTVLVPDLRTPSKMGCAVGRTGRVFFDARPLDWFRGIFG